MITTKLLCPEAFLEAVKKYIVFRKQYLMTCDGFKSLRIGGSSMAQGPKPIMELLVMAEWESYNDFLMANTKLKQDEKHNEFVQGVFQYTAKFVAQTIEKNISAASVYEMWDEFECCH